MATPAVPGTTKAQIQAEFDAYWKGAETGRLESPREQRALIRTAHMFARCFSLFTRAMGDGDAHSRIFLKELTSDTVHLVHALVGGDARGARFYLRSVIENFWRHHYFRDHPVEYGWLHTRQKYYVEMKNLREHCGWLDCFQGKIKPLLNDLVRQYGELSSAVHSTSSKTLVLREALQDIRLSSKQSSDVVIDLRSVLRACLGLCLFSEHATYLGLHTNTQEYLKATLTAAQRRWLDQDIAAAEKRAEDALEAEAEELAADFGADPAEDERGTPAEPG